MADIQHIGPGEVVRYFEELEDPRSPVNRQYPLACVVVIAVMAVLAGAGGPGPPHLKINKWIGPFLGIRRWLSTSSV